MTTDLVLIDEKTIKDKMYYIRGKQVMIDSDLARIYGYSTKAFNQQVQRNIERFPEDFMFQLNESEFNFLMSQFVISKSNKGRGGRRKLPYAFTERGVENLSSILRKPNTIKLTNQILKCFNKTDNNLEVINHLNIKDSIYEYDDKFIMIDTDLARLYEVETKRINEAVKNNPIKFPERFCFKITEEEYRNLKSKVSTSSLINTYGGSRKGHYVFTEQGVAMLATILKSKVAAEVSVNIMDAFVAMRKFIKSNLLEQQYINNLVLEDHESIKEISDEVKLLQETFDKMEVKELKNKIFFNGEIFDSYLDILKILNKAKKEIIIIDNYADEILLEIISKVDKDITLITSKKLLKDIDIKKYNKQYHNLKVIKNNDFHDRFIILDNDIIYHLGSSINHLGNKVFGINIIEEESIKNLLLNKINTIF